MSDTSSPHAPHAPAHEAREAGHFWHSTPMAGVPGHPIHDEDPVTEWLLEHRHIDATEFGVLFAIHKLNTRPRRSAWIRRIELCRSTGLNQAPLSRVLKDLRHKGLVGISPHPVDSTRARYLLIVG